MKSCLFCKIIAKQIPAKIIYEDAELLAFHDINPKADVHFLVIPKEHIVNLMDTNCINPTLLGHMLTKGNEIALSLGLEGYKVQINNGELGGQEVFHLHMHFVGNFK